MTNPTIDPISYNAGIEVNTPERILYVCECCADHYPEGCAHFDRRDVRVSPSGRWLCESCFDDAKPDYLGIVLDEDGDGPSWLDMPPAPEYGPLHRTEPQTAPGKCCRGLPASECAYVPDRECALKAAPADAEPQTAADMPRGKLTPLQRQQIAKDHPYLPLPPHGLPAADAERLALADELAMRGTQIDVMWSTAAGSTDRRCLSRKECDLIVSSLRTGGWREDMPRYRHKKRGSEYTLIDVGKMQAELWCDHNTDPVDMREVAIYRADKDGSLWVRPREEFEDGRFERLPSAPKNTDKEG